jgi:hypothetical protein
MVVPDVTGAHLAAQQGLVGFVIALQYMHPKFHLLMSFVACARTKAKTCCFDFVFDFCKSLYRASS